MNKYFITGDAGFTGVHTARRQEEKVDDKQKTEIDSGTEKFVEWNKSWIQND